MSSSAFCIDAAASTVMYLPCGDGGDVTTVAHHATDANAAPMSVISSPCLSGSNCIRVPAGTTHNYIQFARVVRSNCQPMARSADVRFGSIRVDRASDESPLLP